VSLRPVNQPIPSQNARGTSGVGQILSGLSTNSGLNAIFGILSQISNVGAVRRPRKDAGRIPRQAIERFQKSERAAVTRSTAAKRATVSVKKKPVGRFDPPVFSTKPGVPIERISEVPRPGPDVTVDRPRFSVPSIDFLGGGRPIVHLPAVIPQEKSPVSIWSDLGKSITKGIGQGVQQRITSKIAPAAIVGPALATVGRVLPAVGRVLGSRTVAAASTGAVVGAAFFGGGGGNGGVCPSGKHLNKQDGIGGPARTYCVSNRRMNFGNAKAARRSVRRLKGARKLLRDIEKMMPTRTTKRRAPQHHHHPAAGG